MQARTCAFFSPLVCYFDLLDSSWLLAVALAQPQANFPAMIEVLPPPTYVFLFHPQISLLNSIHENFSQ